MEISSNLRNRTRRSIDSKSYDVSVTNYTRRYNMRLYLSPSTQYNISIKSVTTENKESNTTTLSIWTPSTINFNGTVTFKENESESTISVHVPYIVNGTHNSTLYIIIKGSDSIPCKNYLQPSDDLLEQAGIKKYGTWQAVAISVCIWNVFIVINYIRNCNRLLKNRLNNNSEFACVAVMIGKNNEFHAEMNQ